MEPMRILLVDDHVLFRKGLRALLTARPDMEVVGEAGNGLEAVAQATRVDPEIILMDIHMPKCDGLETVKVIKREMPQVQIIMLTVSDDDGDLFTAIKNGAGGYLLKNMEPGELFEMLEGVRHGEAAISRTLAGKILQEFRQPAVISAGDSEPFTELTPREREVLEHVTEGATNREIAESLFLSENTVKVHMQNILEKLHVRNRIQAAVYAVREGLVDNDPAVQ